jgi:hypothetical protein
VLCPAGIEEAAPPTTANAEPEVVASETFTAAAPVFVMLRLCIAVFPIETRPKLTLIGLADRTGVGLTVGTVVLGVAPALAALV